jgi:hypothetical protein
MASRRFEVDKALRRVPGILLASVVLALALCGGARGDVFVLNSGGQVAGELLNSDQVPRETFVIKTARGIEITLLRSQVKDHVRVRPAMVEYEKIRPRYPDTVEGQLALAEWCRENTLLSQRKVHLERVLELDPDHEEARRLLGYFPRDGQWTTQKKVMEDQGYVLYRGRYRLPEEVKLLKEQQQVEAAEGEWMKKVRLWQGWLGTNKGQLARQNILAIDDPSAVRALASLLQKDPDPRDQARILYIEALAGINTPAARKVLAIQSLKDYVEEVRLTCLDYLKEQKDPSIVEFYIGMLRSKNNQEINRAAEGLRQMGDTSAIGPLIDSLVTVHKIPLPRKNPGGITTTFGAKGSGVPGGLSVGDSGPKYMPLRANNQKVLDALISLSGGVNYSYDVPRWKAWYAAQKRHLDLDARRDRD